MTTRALGASETATSYAAALASGSSKAALASKVEVSPAVPAMVMTNGIPEPVTGTSDHLSTPAESRPKSADSSAPEVSRQSTPVISSNTKQDDDSTSAAAAAADLHEERSNGWEGNSQTSSHPDSKSSGADSARASDYVQPTVTVNVWQKRQEEAAKKSVSPGIPASVSPGPAQKSSASDKGLSTGKKIANTDEKKDVDVRRGTDEVPTKRGNRRGQSQENDTTLSLPPPVTDTISWPTPDLAQGEFKKEKEKEKEKDEKERIAPAAGRGGTKTWVPVAIDPPYVPPIQTKSSREGRGGRGGRGGGRGGAAGSSDRPERITGSGQAAATSGATESERGRQYPTRGTYQGSKGAKRTSSPGGTTQRRESKAGVTNGPTERRKDAAEWNVEANGLVAASGAVQPERSRPVRIAEDATYGGATNRQSSEDQEKAASNHTRPDRGTQWHNGAGRGESESPSTYPPRERGRGGYRGRGVYHNQFANGHHASPAGYQGHSNPASPPFATSNVNTHQYPQHTHPRVGSFRGRGNSGYNAHPYRFNPAMQPPSLPQFAYGGAGLPYEYAMIPGMPVVDYGALTVQINYYFSVDNLIKDIYLRKHMDNDGYVRLSFIMGFQRVQQHTKDINVLRDACLSSPEIQLTYGVDDYYVRKKEGWENWVLKESDRDDSAKRGMSDWHFDPRQRQQQNGTTLTPPGEMSGSAEPFFPDAAGMPFYPQPINTAFGYQTPASILSATVPEFSPSSNNVQQGIDGEINPSVPMQPIDECKDAEVDALMVVVKRPSTGDSGAVQTNGVTDIGGIDARLRNSSLSNGDGAHEESGRTSQSSAHGVDPNMTHRSYSEVRAQALKYRETNGLFKNNDLITLYKFWSHFLVKSFNRAMYREFKHFALQDADMAVRCGIEEIFKMYERSFKDRKTIGYEIINDFVELVKTEARHGETFGMEKLRSILENPNLKDDYRNVIESLLDNDTRAILSQEMAKKGSRSEIYKAATMAS
ncbi:hypothetical protein BZA05DRAFT_215613 [Tricharina praecox]|uniref:uncharacterized protein n=1 Tax=Tricharina praecox TaxID=43433 RepID=UPI002220E475|nr:uncharacterized protein BZA05DRAFT_215613 [Tricharina praecox]KAI5855690.1 hypothetical protein BZA05DRAFT_215613 [Tricharina praecox]